jgi:hypothetical protein
MKKDTLILLGAVLAAIVIGLGLYGAYSSDTEQAQTTSTDQTTQTPAQPQSVTFRVLDAGANAANADTRKNIAAYSKESLTQLWDIVYGSDATTPPQIDFSKEYVIGVFAGQQSTGGYSIAVSSVTDTGNTRNVAVTITKPGQNCFTTEALTNPYQIVVVPVTDATNLERKDSIVTTNCK